MIKKEAFTLAEALIVLGIVAILATISTVMINNIKPDEDIIMFRKAYRTVSQAFQIMQQNTDLFTENCSNEELDQLANYCTLHSAYDGVAYSEAFIKEFAKLIHAVDSSITSTSDSDDIKDQFSTPDGIYWEINNITGGNLDTFELYIYPEGKASKSQACSYDNASPTNTCTRPNKFYMVIDAANVNMSIPISSDNSTMNPVACTYLRYPTINKFNKLPTKSDGNTCYP